MPPISKRDHDRALITAAEARKQVRITIDETVARWKVKAANRGKAAEIRSALAGMPGTQPSVDSNQLTLSENDSEELPWGASVVFDLLRFEPYAPTHKLHLSWNAVRRRALQACVSIRQPDAPPKEFDKLCVWTVKAYLPVLDRCCEAALQLVTDTRTVGEYNVRVDEMRSALLEMITIQHSLNVLPPKRETKTISSAPTPPSRLRYLAVDQSRPEPVRDPHPDDRLKENKTQTSSHKAGSKKTLTDFERAIIKARKQGLTGIRLWNFVDDQKPSHTPAWRNPDHPWPGSCAPAYGEHRNARTSSQRYWRPKLNNIADKAWRKRFL